MESLSKYPYITVHVGDDNLCGVLGVNWRGLQVLHKTAVAGTDQPTSSGHPRSFCATPRAILFHRTLAGKF